MVVVFWVFVWKMDGFGSLGAGALFGGLGRAGLVVVAGVKGGGEMWCSTSRCDGVGWRRGWSTWRVGVEVMYARVTQSIGVW